MPSRWPTTSRRDRNETVFAKVSYCQSVTLFMVLWLALQPSARAKPKVTPRPQGFVLARHLKSAVQIDAQTKALEAQLRAVGARYATSNSLTPGSPYIAGTHRQNSAGNLHGFQETEVEVGMPLWLPGQRDAHESTVTTGLLEVEERVALRQLDVAALVRDAWWTVQRTARELTIARDRVATARDIGVDMTRRTELGDAAPQDALLARNELLAAETELAQVEAAAKAARVSYAVLTGAQPDGILEAPIGSRPLAEHPALRAPSASLARAEAQARLADASFIDNPEIGVFGRREQNLQIYGDGQEPSSTNSTTVGVRVRIPLPTPGRNDPKIAEVEAEAARARAEYGREERIVAAEIAAAKAAVAAARRVQGLADNRLKVASEQFELARKAFQLGENSAADLYRVRQLQLDAQRTRAASSIDLGVAQSRLNQAYGYAP